MLSSKFTGMPEADEFFGWRWPGKFFGGLTNVSGWRRLGTKSAGIGEKRLWLTGLLSFHMCVHDQFYPCRISTTIYYHNVRTKT